MAKKLLTAGFELGFVCLAALALAETCGGKQPEQSLQPGSAGESGASTAGESTGNAGDSASPSGGRSSGGSGHDDSGGSGLGAAGTSEQAATGGHEETGGTEATGGRKATGGVTATGGVEIGGFAQTGGVETGGVETGGNWSTGGTESDIGTVGTWCSSPGALQCAGHRQRVVVVCSGDGSWEPFQTCEVGQFCDTRQGDTLGSCQDPFPGCEGQQAGDQFCQGTDLYACGPDTITADPVEHCEEYCVGGECIDAESCPTGTDWVNCATDCSGPDAECVHGAVVGTYRVTVDAIQAIRMPRAFDVAECDSGRRYALLTPVLENVETVRFTVSSPWLLYKMPAAEDADPPCTESAQDSCVVLGGSEFRLAVFTDEAGAPPANLTVEQVEEDAVCPRI